MVQSRNLPVGFGCGSTFFSFTKAQNPPCWEYTLDVHRFSVLQTSCLPSSEGWAMCHYMILYVHIFPSIAWNESGMSDPKLSELFLDCRSQSFRDAYHHLDPCLLILQEFALYVFWLIIVDLFLHLTWFWGYVCICWLCLSLWKPVGMWQNHHPKNRWSDWNALHMYIISRLYREHNIYNIDWLSICMYIYIIIYI